MNWAKTSLAMDCAASEFYKDGKYVLAGEGNKAFTSEEFTHFLEKNRPNSIRLLFYLKTVWTNPTGMVSRYQTKVLGDKIQLVGDDLFVTNTRS